MKTIQELKKAKEGYYTIFNEKGALAAVNQNCYALKYVKDNIFAPKKMTVEEISELLGFEIQVV